MRATVTVLPDEVLGEISPYIYGHYAEHVADCIYPGLCDPDSELSDEDGLRVDVQAAARELGVPMVRWPGGCFADTYHWTDGVGPAESRPVRRNWHWGGLEPNRFGTDEFLRWCERTGAQPYVNLNLGTGTLDEALRWVDYCVGTDDTADVRARVDNGHPEPYRVRHWGIGNETWGVWEAGTMPVREYARRLANWARFLRQYQPDARVLAVGSAESADPSWDRTVLAEAGTSIDYLTSHVYGYSVDRVSTREYLNVVFTPEYFAARLNAMAEVIRRWEATVDGPRAVRVALDEWNIRHYEPDGAGGHRLNRADPRSMQDAVFAAGVLDVLVRAASTVGIANYVFLVNGNAVLNVRGQRLVRTPLYHVFQRYGEWMRGTAVRTEVDCPRRSMPEPMADRPGHEPVPGGLPEHAAYLDVAAAVDGEHRAVALVNRHLDRTISTTLRGAGAAREAWTLTHSDIHATNDVDHPDRVRPVRTALDPDTRTWDCPPHSVTLLRFTAE